MSMSGEEPQESKNRFRRRFALLVIVALSILILLLIILILMTPGVEELCQYPAHISLESVGNYDGWFNMSVADTCLSTEDNLDTLSLSNVNLFVFWEREIVMFSENGVDVTWISLSDAKGNGLISSYEGAVIYFDTDGDGLVTKGDSLLVKSFASGGPLREGGYIGFALNENQLTVGLYVCCQ